MTKRFCKRVLLAIGLAAMISLAAAPTAEAGRRHHYRLPAYRVHYAYHPHRVVHPVQVHRAPVVVVPVVPTVRYYGHYHGPSVYFHGYVW